MEKKRLSVVLALILALAFIIGVIGCDGPKEYSLTIAVSGQGATDPSTGTQKYDKGSSVTITATPTSGWEFDHWSGDASGNSATTTVTMDSDKTVTANFTSPSITIALDYYGIRNTHWIEQVGGDQQADIQLVVLVRDDQQNLATFSIPQNGIPSFMEFFQVNALEDNMDPKVFTGRTSGSLTFSVAAFNINKNPITKAQLDVIKEWTGVDWSSLKYLLPDKELVGSYWHTWSPSQNWAIGGNYDNLYDSNADLRVWLRVGTAGQMPEPVPKPVLKPDVTIVDLTLPTNAKVSGGLLLTTYPTTIRLKNKESCNIDVHWEAHSSVTGTYDSGDIIVPAKDFSDIKKWYYYTTAGPCEITYTIKWAWRGDGRELDTRSDTMVVLP